MVQIIGRAACNVDGQVVMYTDNITDPMQRAIHKTNRRCGARREYRPQTVRKRVSDILELVQSEVPVADRRRREVERCAPVDLEGDDLARLVMNLEEEMHEAAKDLRFEYAALLRDEINELKRELSEVAEAG